MPSRMNKSTSSNCLKPLLVTRTAPRITLVGRGRAESISSTPLIGLRNPKDQKGEIWESGAVIPSKRAPVLADEGIGTLVVAKLPLEEMSMSTRTLRAIQEDHSLSKSRSPELHEEPQLQLVKVEESSSITRELKPAALITSAEPSTSLGEQTSARSKKIPMETLACAHQHCHSTFSLVDDLISHLVNFHCQHQFRPRKLTFVSPEKYELWKASHQKAYDTTMVEHGVREESDAQCKYCRKWFPSQVVMNRHVREEHTDPHYPKGTTIECGDPHCDVVCDRMSTLCEHVAQEHGRDDLVIEEFKFPNLQRFKEWKDQVETDTMSKLCCCHRVELVSAVYYLCHLSGYANRSRHSAVQVSRLRSTKKLGRYCTAFMNAKEISDGSVIVHCCLGHFGHNFDVSRLPLPSKVKDEVAELLLKGMDSQTVHDMVRKKYTSADRGFYLKRYEVRNIADKLRKQGLISPKERESILSPLSTLHSDQTPGKPDKHPQQSVRFQSVRSLPDGHVSGNHSDAAPNSIIAGIRDVSPPIIGPCTYVDYRGGEYEEIDVVSGHQMVEGDEDSLTYFVDEVPSSENMPNLVHSVRDESSRPTKIMPLLMEPQPTGNAGFDETMTSLNRRINALHAQIKQTVDPSKVNMLMAQVRALQGQLVRGVPQTTAFLQTLEPEFDGEEDVEEERFEAVEHDDTVCLEVEVESSEAPYREVQVPAEEHYEEDLSTVTFEGEPYEEVVSAGYEHSADLSYHA
ncbi:zinc finger, C2H2 type [Ostertagia ostertagi]